MSKLLDLRVADADENISRIQAALEKVNSRRYNSRIMHDRLQKLFNADESIYSIETLITYCQNIASQGGSTWPLLQEKVTKGGRAWRDVFATLLKIQQLATELNKSCSNEIQVETHKKRTIDLVKTKHDAIEEIRSNLRQQTATAPGALFADIETTKPLWGEHIETMAGMILRDESFDNGLSAQIDRLIEICAGHPPFSVTSTLNILGRDHTELKDLHYTVYFRFPTWSVWGLPLTAHEFWHASSLGRERLKERLNKIPQADSVWEEPLVQDCLADTFATFVMGPAYAFACIGLLLDVTSLQDRLRANTIFATADYLARGNEESYAFISELQHCWKEATTGAAGIQQSTSGGCLLARECHLVNRLLESQWAHNRNPELTPGWISCPLQNGNQSCPMVDTVLIDKMRDALLQFLPAQLRYGAHIWRAAGDQLQNLLNPGEEEPQVPASLPDGVDLRHVLHAAWLNRWEAADQDTVYITEVSKRVIQLCDRVATQRADSGFGDDPNGPKFV